MDFLSSKRFISIVLAILVVLNLGLLGTLLWQNTHPSQKQNKVAVDHKFRSKQSFFQKELRLTEEQTRQFNTLRRQHFQGTLPALVAISGMKRQLIHEALKAEPDTLAMKTLAGTIGKQQAIVEYRLAWHFNNLSKVCTPEQRDSLQRVLEKVTAKPFKLKRRLLLRRIEFPPLQKDSSEKHGMRTEESAQQSTQ